MAEFKIVLNDPKTGKSYQREVKDADAEFFKSKKIGETVKGEGFNLTGYEFLITGGSDKSGFPLRKDIDMSGKKKILATKGIGIKPKRKGMRVRKTVAGAIIGDETVQINLKIVKYGKEKLGGEDAPTEGDAKPTEEKKK